ncbi:tRNA (N(6)-L-threonylcarbamoyladenosine(37)-C(2))-methylthiotransferase MtaB [Caldisericum exile]|uniref:tRNA (N(6)-L-threonylcarbamoyladenosine(37)-C(2))-methylthiotransferase n=1 Tax=Caldisericum exile (strain DSM 21853 / NBRC 104410 / AZM16c01) TaxID=511051 RepID=A0A7U6JEP0_CALEA|nr:tRNA (N(6)-L-threonylcarbamoyladenosine(37)-C(2))-methylthiotransferase MtaB [Caldisericum exile]BAL80673.1 MiaB-like tRNA modifying enzyme family protein [Caldisericum exile AZM16c01]
MTFAIFTLGCKTNQYESELMRESLLNAGYSEVNFKDIADIYIVNSCVVTEKAERETRKALNEALRRNPKAMVILTGCYVKLHNEDRILRVYFYRGSKSKISDFIKTGVEEHTKEDERIESFLERSRAFVKIEEGCNNFCTYCIVPFVRGYEIRSKKKELVIDEVKRLVDKGFKEIVLTGTEIGKYGVDLGITLVDLIKELKKIDGLKRLRISSIHPKHVSDELIYEFKEPYALQPHLHISLQSGDNEVLKRMNRGYTREEYLEIVEKLRSIDPNFSISTDIIVGFPFETEHAFFNSLSIIREVTFSKVHVFRYSKRPFTPAFYFKESVPEITKTVRSERTREFANIIAKEFKEHFVGDIVEVLVEEEANGVLVGFTPYYLKVEFRGKAPINSFANVRIMRVEPEVMYGELVSFA